LQPSGRLAQEARIIITLLSHCKAEFTIPADRRIFPAMAQFAIPFFTAIN
jgi:hypothetical protein